MRGLLILGGLVILSAAAWTGTADAGGGGHGSGHGGHGHGGLEGRMTRGAGHVDLVGILLSTEFWHEEAGPGPVAPEMFSGGVMVDGSEHVVADHLEGPAIHPMAHIPLRLEGGAVSIPQPTEPGGAGSGHDDAATAQPYPAVSPWLPRPPGAAGPGRRVSGWSGPGRPGPGRPASLR